MPSDIAQRRPYAPRAAAALAGLLGVAGLAHFLVPAFYDAVIPHLLPGTKRGWVLASGAAELACAVAVARPRTRRVGSTVAAALFIAVFPANVQMAIDWRHGSVLRAVAGFARLPLQVPLVWWAWRVGHPRSGPDTLRPVAKQDASRAERQGGTLLARGRTR